MREGAPYKQTEPMGNLPPKAADSKARAFAEDSDRERDVPQRDTLEFRADDLFRLQTTAGDNGASEDSDAIEDRDTVEIPNVLAVELVVESAAQSRPSGAVPGAQKAHGSDAVLDAERDDTEAEAEHDARLTIPAPPAGH